MRDGEGGRESDEGGRESDGEGEGGRVMREGE